jgi:glycosyltransferase involved in cell wall biosynthesis
MVPDAGRRRGLRILAAGHGPRARLASRAGDQPGLLGALDRRYEVVGTVEPRLGRLRHAASVVRYFYPDRDAWRSRAGLNPRVYRELTADAERRLSRSEVGYDLIMLIQTLFSPGSPADGRRYTVFTDNIYSLTARFYPAWAPLGRRDGIERARLEQEACRGAQYVFATSHFLRDAMLEDYGCDPDRVVRVGLGANALRPSLEEKPDGSQAALFVGVDFERKGGETLLRAWPAVREREPRAELWVVGPGGRAPAAAEQPGIHWHGFVSDREQLAALYSRAQAFVLPSLFEPFGRSVFEAMGHGLPCIVSDGGGIAESVEPGVDGLLVPAGDPEPLADALALLLGDPDLARRMGSAGHRKVLAHDTWDEVVARMAPHIEAAASGG